MKIKKETMNNSDVSGFTMKKFFSDVHIKMCKQKINEKKLLRDNCDNMHRKFT